MNFLLQHKRLAIVFGILLILCIVGIVLFSTRGQRPTTEEERNLRTSPTPQVNPENIGNPTGIEQSREYKESFQQTEQQQKAFMEKEAAIGQLVKKLPYGGNNFSMEYDIGTNQFTTIISANNRNAGTEEFNQFLRQNNIDSPNQIRNLTTVYR